MRLTNCAGVIVLTQVCAQTQIHTPSISVIHTVTINCGSLNKTFIAKKNFDARK